MSLPRVIGSSPLARQIDFSDAWKASTHSRPHTELAWIRVEVIQRMKDFEQPNTVGSKMNHRFIDVSCGIPSRLPCTYCQGRT